ncbi:UPF0149 family protein [Arenimonas sp. MALMAid1274]|uniref:UPF0149 family protein n=1 Tax=Arenimonas sp. MALMAid1274 TaxID=3411630 RepID=UPI003BA2CBE6
MSEAQLPDHDALVAELQALEAGIDPCELHGSLCGYLSAGGKHEAATWLAAVMADPLLSAPDAGGPMDQLYRASTRQLDSPDFEFEMLMPGDERPVSERGDGLVAWCRGFLGGFGLAAGAKPPLSDESEEALADIGRIAASDLSYDDPEADEDALAEVAEFIRVAVLLLHSDCVLGPRHRRKLN